MFRRPTPHQCSLVHIDLCGYVVFYTCSHQAHAVQHNQHMWTCAERHRARVLKRPQGKWAFALWRLDNFSALIFARVLNNTEVKGHYSTICRHACFGVLRLISAAWYTSTYVAALYLYTCTCSHQTNAVQHNQHIWTCAERHRARVLKGSELLHYSVYTPTPLCKSAEQHQSEGAL